MSVLKVIFILLEVLILFNLLIFVHELGHFLAARWRGLKVLRFAIWFGKPIWKARINDVEYVLGTIPFGGYVSLPQMAPMDAIEGSPDEEGEPQEPLPPVSALDKIIVAFAGPLFSFLLAVAFAFVVWGVGRPLTEAETTTTIGVVVSNGPAAKAGLLVGDTILEIDGKPVTKFRGMGPSVTWRIVASRDETIPIKVRREGEEMTFQVTPEIAETKAYERKALRQIKIGPAYTAVVGQVISNSPAAMAGLKMHDEILEYNEQPLVHWSHLGDFVTANPDKPVTLKISRDGEPLTMTLTPEVPIQPTNAPPMLGIKWSDGGRVTIANPGVWEQVVGSVDAMVKTLGAIFSRDSDIKAQHLSGAVKILNIYYILFESEQGWRMALWFSVLLNVNLAILNLLPIPVLDGGHIVLAIVEGLRRRPVSATLLGYLQTACAILLIGFMLYVTFYDVQDLGRGGEALPEIRFSPKPASPEPSPAP